MKCLISFTLLSLLISACTTIPNYSKRDNPPAWVHEVARKN
jgi:starvation-inducible outer membrane lipoprotein